MHPVFKYQGILGNLEVTPSAMVSGSELSIHMGLPRKSVCGLSVIEHADFGKEVINYDGDAVRNGINLGKIFNMGREASNRVFWTRIVWQCIHLLQDLQDQERVMQSMN